MRRLSLIISMLCLCHLAMAQRFASFRQYATLSAGLGINGYAYNMTEDGSKDSNGGVTARLGYHFVRGDFGFWVGMMIQSYNSNTIVNYDQRIDGAVDQDGDLYVHITKFRSLEENHKQLILSIPLEFNYRLYLGDGMKMILGIGPLFQFSMKNSYRVLSGDIKTEMLYPEYGDMLVSDIAPQHHLYTASGFNGKYNLKSAPGCIFDVSILYPLERNFELNLGLYGTMSFASQMPKSGDYLYDPDCKAKDAYKNSRYNGVFNSSVASKLSPFSIGFQVGLYYNIPLKDKSSKSQ